MVKRKKKKVIVEALTIKLNNKVRRSLRDEETLEHMLHFCRDILFARKFIIITHTHTVWTPSAVVFNVAHVNAHQLFSSE